MNKTVIVGEIKRDIYGSWSDCDQGLYIGNELLESFLDQFKNKTVKISIEILPDIKEEKDEPKVYTRLGEIVRSDDACSYLGINIWCVSEGANPDEMVGLPVSKAKEFNLI